MDKIEKRMLVLAVLLLGSFVFALLYNAYGRKIDEPECTPYNAKFTDPKLKKIDEHHYELYAVAHMWAFEPSQIQVPEGSTVDLYLTSADVVHGYDIERKGLNLMAIPGTVNRGTIVFDKAGAYKITCNEYCGYGHQSMQGEILVTLK